MIQTGADDNRQGRGLQPVFFLEKIEQDTDHTHNQDPDGKITVFPFQFRHIFEIHAVNTGDKGQGNKNGGGHGEGLHDFIGPVVHIGQKGFVQA